MNLLNLLKLNPKITLFIIIVVLYLTSLFTVYHYAQSNEKQLIQYEQLQDYKKGVERNEKIDKDVRSMDIIRLDRTLSKWLRTE